MVFKRTRQLGHTHTTAYAHSHKISLEQSKSIQKDERKEVPSEDLGIRRHGWCRMEGERSGATGKEEVRKRADGEGGKEGWREQRQVRGSDWVSTVSGQ